jgi:hypothetical protein
MRGVEVRDKSPRQRCGYEESAIGLRSKKEKSGRGRGS